LKIVETGAGAGGITLYDFEPKPDRICEDVHRGLTATPKQLPPKYFYDDRGAQLFARITTLEAYYPTRTEIGILRRHAGAMADRIGEGARLVEFGSGSGDKTWIILRHLRKPAAYVPVDISRAQLVEFAMKVAEAFPALSVAAVCADYTQDYELPPLPPTGRTLAFFPGSTLGNFEIPEAEHFLARVRRLVGRSGALLIGLDLRKDPRIIERAYNDPEGVTAEFNLNLLARINRECGGDFDLTTFRHHALFDRAHSRIEMRLVSDRAQTVTISAETDASLATTLSFAAGEHIVTEYSYKFDLDEFAALAARAGWRREEVWTDENSWFAVMLLG
jgi:dimethylhistidine N-methyltransferase